MGASVVTIHDLMYYLYPGLCPNVLAHYYARFVFKAAARASKRIIADSEHTKRDIVKNLGAAPEKVAVIYCGVDEIYRPEKDGNKLKAIRDRYGIEREYILYVGNHGDNKNLLRLIHAYSMLKARKRYNLLIGGKIDPRRTRLYRAPEELGIADSVTFTGYLPDEDLPGLYTMASLFVFPSLYEGFGFPPLEAMACGTPVVCSNATSLPEVAGDAALMFNPLNADEMTERMDEALSDEALRAGLREKGLERASAFSWREAALKTLGVYYEAYA